LYNAKKEQIENAAMVQSMDEAVGRVPEAGVADNTIIVFRAIPPTNNAPLRGGKATLYEGGTREPCIVIWPARVKPGSRSDQVITSVDFYPTIREMTGLNPKPGLEVRRRQRGSRAGWESVEAGGSLLLLPALHRHHRGHARRVRSQGDWKLIRFWADEDNQTDRLELYTSGMIFARRTTFAGRC
jgi:arylsulfatase A-like enzyme